MSIPNLDTVIFRIGQTERGRISSVKVNGVTDNTLTGTWYLYDANESLLSSGAVSYTGTPGIYEFYIPADAFASEAPTWPNTYKRGRVHVELTGGGDTDGAFGAIVNFMYPKKTAA